MAHSEELPLPDYDQLNLGNLRHRIRSLDEDSLRTVLNHECGHAARVPVLEILEARLHELEAGAEPSPGDPSRGPEGRGNTGRVTRAAVDRRRGHHANAARSRSADAQSRASLIHPGQWAPVHHAMTRRHSRP